MIYAEHPVDYAHTPAKLVFLTGLSNPSTCRLSEVQHAFMASLAFPEAWKVYRNFPWTEGDVEVAALPLWRAAMHNGWQFLLASTPLFRRLAARHWQAMVRSTDHLLIVTGSCGLQIANCLMADEISCPTRIDLLGFGPVAWRRPSVNHCLVRGESDYIARFFFRRVEQQLVGVRHMMYLEDPRMKEITERWISDNTSK